MIGEITGGTVYWNQSMLWFRERQKKNGMIANI